MNLKKTLSSIAVGAGAVALGLGIQYASAAWTSAPSTPPSSNVDAPINVGSSNQAKQGSLAIGTSTIQTAALDVEGIGYLQGVIASSLQLVDAGAAQHQDAGKVLTSDQDGNATWQAAAGFSYYIASSTATVNHTFTSPISGTYPVSEAFCNSGDKVISGGGIAYVSNSQARRALWYNAPDPARTDAWICSSTDPNQNDRLDGCSKVWAMCAVSH